MALTPCLVVGEKEAIGCRVQWLLFLSDGEREDPRALARGMKASQLN